MFQSNSYGATTAVFCSNVLISEEALITKVEALAVTYHKIKSGVYNDNIALRNAVERDYQNQRSELTRINLKTNELFYEALSKLTPIQTGVEQKRIQKENKIKKDLVRTKILMDILEIPHDDHFAETFMQKLETITPEERSYLIDTITNHWKNFEEGSIERTFADKYFGGVYKDLTISLKSFIELNINFADHPDSSIKIVLFSMRSQHPTVFAQALKIPNLDINYTTPETYLTPLMMAAMSGNITHATSLLKMPGVDVNLTTEKYNSPPLIIAASYGRLDIVKLLMETPGINLHLKNKDGNTALDEAIENANTALAQAKSNSYPQIIELLTEHKVPKKIKNWFN